MTSPGRPTERHGAFDDEVEELADDAIIAQETEAHAPQRRQQVRIETQSVVISEPAGPPSQPQSAKGRAVAEPTLVIRDRRVVDELRQALAREQARRRTRKSLYVLGFVAAFGALLASLVMSLGRDRGEPVEADTAAPTSAKTPQPTSSAARPHLQTTQADHQAKPARASAEKRTKALRKSSDSDVAERVSLEELPLE